MDHIPRLSEVMYVGLCQQIGTPTEVAIRRDVMDMEDMIKKPVRMHTGIVLMESGSIREGFRLRSSDKDIMFWTCKYKLISDISQARVYNISKHAIILMENSDTPPGFVILRLLTFPEDNIIPYLVPFNGGTYISSSLWTEGCMHSFKNAKEFPLENVTIHGPCANGFGDFIEFDFASCFITTCWPKLIKDWVDRCQRHIWPPVPVLKKILRNRCHCVSIGSKTASASNELEWRLSFSQAEQQLVCTMNHTQFLCYGLLKIFLKEVISYRKEPLLCSYHMKTTMFWIMQSGSVRWDPNNLLNSFWMCFKYIIHCVYRGVFPNFFISQNNMFLNKVVGETRESLLHQLYQYYRMGISCLLLSPTLGLILEPALISPSFVLSFTQGESIDVANIDMCGMSELFQIPFLVNSIPDCYIFFKSIDTLSRLSISAYQSLTLQCCTADTLVCIAFNLANSISCCRQRNVYILDRMICNMLKLAARFSFESHILYLALYYYRTGRYEKTLHIAYLTKQRLPQDFNVHYCIFNRQRYNELVGNLPLSRRMKTAWIQDLHFHNGIPYIEELSLEQNNSEPNGKPVLNLSPFIIVEMLSVLSHFRLDNISQSDRPTGTFDL